MSSRSEEREIAGGAFVVSAARVFDGESTHVDHAVLIEDGMVTGLLPCDSIPPSVPSYHEPECTVLPGLIDTHVHFMRCQGPQYLAYGVTTVRDTGNNLAWILGRRDEWRENHWPRLLCMGPLIDGPSPLHEFVSRACVDVEDGIAAVREAAGRGVDGIKFYTGVKPEWLPSMVEEAHAGGNKVSQHCLGGGATVAVQAGVDEFYHLDGILADVWPDHPPGWLYVWGLPEFGGTVDRQKEVADQIRASGITATPTLAYWDSQWRIRSGDFQADRFIPNPLTEWQSVPVDRGLSEQWRRALHAAQGFVGLLLERGVPILCGTDVPFGPIPPGLSLWYELSLLVESGMSPEQAVRSATSEAGSFLDRPELGRLTPGSTADMVVVKGNPLEGIPSRPDVVSVVHGGIRLEPKDLMSKTDHLDLDDEPWARQLESHFKRRQELR